MRRIMSLRLSLMLSLRMSLRKAALRCERAGSVPEMTIQEVSVDDLAAALTPAADAADAADAAPEATGARVIDVREIDEYVSGHVPGSIHVALGTVPEHIDVFAAADGATTYVICRSGGRSMHAAQYLAEQGIVTVNVAGGTMAWIQAGHAVITGDQPS
jgi:rhodanese-related sulfurtransferase